MAKTIVFCADGTWNGPGHGRDDAISATSTNVLRLFDLLAGAVTSDTDAADGETERDLPGVQVSKYLAGVGVSSNPLVHLLGGGMGAGIIARIVRGYTFISRNYVAGDRIVLTGFSRGAYTAWALAGMIAAMGLLDAKKEDLSDREAAYRAGVAVWFAYRRQAKLGDPLWLEQVDALAEDFTALLQAAPVLARIAAVPITAIGVWDTVGSLGIPDPAAGDVFRFADTKLAACVGQGFHAVSLDERRTSFEPTLWAADPRVVQMLFPGAHADVGGGYDDAPTGLAACALGWMVERLAGCGVQFAGAAPAGNPLGVAHQPWAEGLFAALPNAARRFPAATLSLADAVLSRQGAPYVLAAPGAVPVKYAPDAIPDVLRVA